MLLGQSESTILRFPAKAGIQKFLSADTDRQIRQIPGPLIKSGERLVLSFSVSIPAGAGIQKFLSANIDRQIRLIPRPLIKSEERLVLSFSVSIPDTCERSDARRSGTQSLPDCTNNKPLAPGSSSCTPFALVRGGILIPVIPGLTRNLPVNQHEMQIPAFAGMTD